MEISARVQKMCDKYNMEPEDVAYADMLNAGWGKHEGAYYAYHLAYFDLGKIKVWLKDKLRNTPGINLMVDDLHNEEVAKMRELKEYEAKLKEKAKKDNKKNEKLKTSAEDALRSKSGMLETLIDLASTPGLDVKLKADLLKQITDLQNYKKEEIKEEDNRTHFFLPLTCAKCSLYAEFKKRQRENKTNDNEDNNHPD